MINEVRRHLITAVALGSVIGLMGAAPTAAQDADFLFKRPTVTLGLRIGYAVPSANSEVFDFTRQELTVDKSDFSAPFIGGELDIHLTERFDIAVGLGVGRSETRSEFRDWVDDQDLPIEQDTRFQRVPLTIGGKAYLTERGRRVSRLVWVPKKIAPFVGAGVGMVWYRFEQIGDFVDFETLEIFSDRFDSSGSSPMAYAGAGVDVSLGSKWIVTGEARYSWASAGMDRDFVGFEDIDLNGFRAMVGFSVRM